MRIDEQANGRVQVRTFEALGVRTAYGTRPHLPVDQTLLRQVDFVERAAEDYDNRVATLRGDKTLSGEAGEASIAQQRAYLDDAVAVLRANAQKAFNKAISDHDAETAIWMLSVAQAYQWMLDKTELLGKRPIMRQP